MLGFAVVLTEKLAANRFGSGLSLDFAASFLVSFGFVVLTGDFVAVILACASPFWKIHEQIFRNLLTCLLFDQK